MEKTRRRRGGNQSGKRKTKNGFRRFCFTYALLIFRFVFRIAFDMLLQPVRRPESEQKLRLFLLRFQLRPNALFQLFVFDDDLPVLGEFLIFAVSWTEWQKSTMSTPKKTPTKR